MVNPALAVKGGAIVEKGLKTSKKVLDDPRVRNTLNILSPLNPLNLVNWIIFIIVYVATFFTLIALNPDFIKSLDSKREDNIDIGKVFLYSLLISLIPYYLISYIVNRLRITATRKVLSYLV